MGPNFQRLAWIYLPVAVVATAGVRLRVALVACALPVALGVQATAHDLWVSAQPMSSQHYYDGLAAELNHTRRLADYRLEVVPDGTHTAAYVLLNSAMLARGYETQQDTAQNALLMSPLLDAVSYKIWLDNNAVGYVAIGRHTLSANAEQTLVRRHRPAYLTQIWSSPQWLLYRVTNATPVITPPATVVGPDQASMEVSVPHAGRYAVRVRWSRFLKTSSTSRGIATITNDGFGFTRLTVTGPGRYTLHG